MRKSLVTVLAAPIVLLVYLGTFLRPSIALRAGLAIAAAVALGFGIGLATRPAPAVATPPTTIAPVPEVAFTTTVQAAAGVKAPAIIDFSTPMEAASVAAALRVEPATDVRITWSADARTLTVSPSSHWLPGTFHTITVEPGALASNGRPLTTPVRASFLTREPTSAVVAATSVVGERVAVDTAFTVAFDGPIDAASVRNAIRLSPSVPARVELQPSIDGATRLLVTPAERLAAGTTYRILVAGIRDADGLALEAAALEVRTPTAPKVARFRPAAGTGDLARDETFSVRFTKSMDRSTTKAAFSLTADGKAVEGRISFAEDDTVLVFEPAARFPYEAKVVATVAASATSRDGAPLAEAAEADFTIKAKPAPKPEAPTGGGGGGGSGDSGGGSAGSGSWSAVERYYLDLMNCTRTGGSVTSSGRCSSPGGRDVAPLKLSSGISSKVARPYAKLLATRNLCDHFVGGNPGDRLRRAGYTSYRWAENLGCRSGNPYDAVLDSHRYFQSERDWSPQGGHYVNLMNAKYDRAGIGVWVASGRVRLVVVFYHP